MALIFIRTAIIFITLLLVMRLMGKSQIGEMQPFEFVIRNYRHCHDFHTSPDSLAFTALVPARQKSYKRKALRRHKQKRNRRVPVEEKQP